MGRSITRETSKHKDKKRKHIKHTHSERIHHVFNLSKATDIFRDLLSRGSTINQEIDQLLLQLDQGKGVEVDEIPDGNLKKKLRHFFRAMGALEKISSKGIKSYKKDKKIVASSPSYFMDQMFIIRKALDLTQNQNNTAVTINQNQPHFSSDVSLMENTKSLSSGVTKGPTMPSQLDVQHLKKYLETSPCPDKAEAEGLQRETWMTQVPKELASAFQEKQDCTPSSLDRLQTLAEEDESARLKQVMDEYNRTYRAKSLTDLRREGFVPPPGWNAKLQEYENLKDLWGKRSTNQKRKGRLDMGYSEELSTDSFTRVPFDREMHLQNPRQVTEADYKKLMEQSKALRSQFTDPKFQSTFL